MIKKLKISFRTKAYKEACIPDKTIQEALAIYQKLNCKN